jgi:UDPglucose--hexose-1-phosphate uridylyltransferase
MIRDPISGDWSLRAPTRAARPNEYLAGPSERCPFCPGNEELTPPEIARSPADGPWAVRVFANKYPAIVPPLGLHEVIVEGPGHSQQISATGVAMWRERYCAALDAVPAGFALLFKNCGAAGGATIVHPHSQLVVLPQRPARIAAMEASAREYRLAHAHCIWCDEADRSSGLGLLVEANDALRAYVRDESRFASALTILPRECAASPNAASDATWKSLAALLERLGAGIGTERGVAASFNVLLLGDAHSAAFHWHVEVVLRRGAIAGFELSSGAFIREGEAKESAEGWRRMLALSNGPK